MIFTQTKSTVTDNNNHNNYEHEPQGRPLGVLAGTFVKKVYFLGAATKLHVVNEA